MKTGILLSGGMDSIAICFWRRPQVAFTFDYGQKAARGEFRAAKAVAETLEIEHHCISVDLRALGSGDMAGGAALSIAAVPEWWPFRNQMLITLAAMKGVALGIDHLLIGTLSTDGRHADGTVQFTQAMDSVLRTQEGNISLEAPAINMTAVDLIRESKVPDDLLSWSHSCHVSDFACGICRGCQKHYETTLELGLDPY